MKIRLAICLLLIVLASSAIAHLEGGKDVAIGNYLVDFGYDPEVPKVGESTTLMFSLVNSSSEELVETDSTWTRISKGEDVLFTGDLSPQPSGTFMLSYTFSEPGEYEVTVRFGSLAEHEFDLTVEGKISGYSWGAGFLFAELILVLVIFAGAIYVYRKK